MTQSVKGADNFVRGRFAEFIVAKIRGIADGSQVERILDDKPSGKLFIGNLSPRKIITKDDALYTKTSPSAAGIELLLAKRDLEKAILKITVSSSFYYKVFPTRAEQAEICNLRAPEGTIPPIESATDETDSTEEASATDCRLRQVFKKVRPEPLRFDIEMTSIFAGMLPWEGILDQPKQLAEAAKSIFAEDPQKYRRKKENAGNRWKVDRIPVDIIESEETWDRFFEQWEGEAPQPKWNLHLSYKIIDFGDELVKFTLKIENAHSETFPDKDLESSLFETALAVEPINFQFKPFVLEYLRDDYHYDGNINASGINCSITKVGNSYRIEHMPVFVQKKFKSKDPVRLEFSVLAQNPFPHLLQLASSMQEELERLKQEYRDRIDLTEGGRLVFKEEIDRFESEIDRFRKGIDTLQSNAYAHEAFCLMNKAFSASSKGFSSWRMFQIVFIVMEIPDILAASGVGSSDTLKDVDLIYFPTGGGKTEAYLGLVVFTVFFDRFRGKKDGVSAITRFPLRLLSLQQLQRIADVFAKAELLRRNHGVIGAPGYAAFSTGYYVGQENTPNKVYKPSYRGEPPTDEITTIESDEERQEKYKIISTCPFCGKPSVKLRGDPQSLRIIHYCTNESCAEEIPVYISDDEIFRYLPTFIVSTLDKMASAATSKEFKSMFGRVSGRCPRHGYFIGPNCAYKKNKYNRNDPLLCDEKKYLPSNLVDPVPSLIIQDELHLIRESAGTYDSHYETMLQHFAATVPNGKTMKIIGSSATMTQYWEQVRQLYMKKGHQFPAYRQFYADEDEREISRLIAGIMPHNKTIIYAVLDLVRLYYEELNELRRDPERLLESDIGFTSREEVLATLRDYDLGLNYNLVKREGDRMSQSITAMVNPELRRRNIPEMKTKQLTGDVTFKDVKQVLASIEGDSDEKPPDLIIATSMISHGVDIDKMNFMVFRGMPRNVAEYIQAYSRVGRKYPGIIFVVFNPARERDQSYYKYFQKFHEYKDLLVEPVPLNRWAKFAVNRTLPGIFSTCVINYLENGEGISPYRPDLFRQQVENRDISIQQIIDFALASYQFRGQEMAAYFDDLIRSKIDRYADEAMTSDGNFVPYSLSDKPMSSFRDSDIQILVAPTKESFEPMNRISYRSLRSVEE